MVLLPTVEAKVVLYYYQEKALLVEEVHRKVRNKMDQLHVEEVHDKGLNLFENKELKKNLDKVLSLE